MKKIIHNLENTFALLWKMSPKGPFKNEDGDLVMHDFGVIKDDSKLLMPPYGVHVFLLSKTDAMGNDLLDEYLKLGMELYFIGRKHYSMRIDDIKWTYEIVERTNKSGVRKMLVVKYDNELVHFESSTNGDVEITATGHMGVCEAEKIMAKLEEFRTREDDPSSYYPCNTVTERRG